MELAYSIKEKPSWHISIFLGFQHFLTAFTGFMIVPFVVLPFLCCKDEETLSHVINTNCFVSGLITLIQTTVGVRLPIVQGGSAAYIAPIFAIMSLKQWRCLQKDDVTFSNNINGSTQLNNISVIHDNEDDEWLLRMREIQGAIILSSLVQVVIGATGVIGLLLRFIGPLTVAPIIALIGISLFDVASSSCQDNWLVALMTMILVLVFSQYVQEGTATNYSNKSLRLFLSACCRICNLFPVILAVFIMWMICFVLTLSGAIPDDPHHWAYSIRTDANSQYLTNSDWFYVPYPGQFGVPTYSLASTLGMLTAVLAGILESVGDYYTCARLAGAPPPPRHAINRGIFVEGIGGVLSGLFGTATGTASYSSNIAVIGITKVGSNRVIICSSIIMLLLGVVGKFGAIIVSIPGPIIGGLIMVLLGMVSAVGISSLQFVDLNSSRNLCIFGLSIVFGLSFPRWLTQHPDYIQTGNDTFDQAITVLLGTSLMVGGTVAFVLDNTMPGTEKERGIYRWCEVDAEPKSSKTHSVSECYDLQCSYLNTGYCASFIPIFPAFDETRHTQNTDHKSNFSSIPQSISEI